MVINGNQWKSLETCGHQWKSMEIIGNLRVGKLRLRTKETKPEIPRSQRTASEVKARGMEEL